MSVTRDDLIAAFREAGHELWLVGGVVRDRYLGVEGGDEDFATDAFPDAVEAIARGLGATVATVGQRFGTVGVRIDGRWFEITTFRGDSYAAGSRWPNVTFGRSIEEDLARRDFTVNAIAVDAFTGRELDPYGGREDIARRLIRAVGDPATRFREDPLRILRGVRFVSQLDFSIERATKTAMAETVALLSTLSQERVTSELEKLLVGREPGKGLAALEKIGALPVILPEVADMPGCEQNSFHRFDVWWHTVATVEAIERAAEGEERETRAFRGWLALLHDVGKPAVRHMKPNGEWGFYRHEAVGAEIAHEMLRRLRLGRQRSEALELLIRRHMDRPEPDDARSVRRFMRKCEGRWRELIALKRADNASHTYDDREYHDRLWAACERAEREESEALRAESPLDGNELMSMFDRPPGPWIARVKERLSDMVLDGQLAPGDKQAAAAIARGLMEETWEDGG